MNYKTCNENYNQDHKFIYVIDQLEHIDYSQTQDIDLQYINDIFEQIQIFYLNNDDKEALKCLYSLKSNEIANNQDIYSIFDANNLSSILLDYASSMFDSEFNFIAILKINDFINSNDDRYIIKFMNLSILARISHLLNDYNYLTSFVILLISYICKYKQSLDYLQDLKFNFNNFFDFLLQSHGRRSSDFMKSFDLLVHIYNPNEDKNEIINILRNIDKMIQKLPVEELSLYDKLFEYICELTDLDFFYQLVDQTQLVQHLIDLIYRINQRDIDKTFFKYLFSLICFFTQSSNCPEIQGAYLIDFYYDFKDPIISKFIFCIIGNLCEKKYEEPQNLVFTKLNLNPSENIIEYAIQKGFIDELVNIIDESCSYQKIDALICFSKFFSFSSKSMQECIIESSGVDLQLIMENLIDSLSFYIDETESYRLLAILNILEYVQQQSSYSDLIDFIEETDAGSITELQFDDEDEMKVADDIKLFLESVYHDDN